MEALWIFPLYIISPLVGIILTLSGIFKVTEWVNSAKNKVEILSVDKQKAKDALYKTQVTTRSPMGSIVFETGGILVDNGWIRILGSGSEN